MGREKNSGCLLQPRGLQVPRWSVHAEVKARLHEDGAGCRQCFLRYLGMYAHCHRTMLLIYLVSSRTVIKTYWLIHNFVIT